MVPATRTSVDVALCQNELRPVEGTVDLLTDLGALLDRAGPADVYVLPELLGVAVGLDDGDRPITLEEDQIADLHGFLHAEAADRDAVVVGGSYNVRETDGTIRNRAPIATPDGVETYDKRHPIPAEREDGKAAGETPPPVVEHHGVGIGVLVCYDVEFPGAVRDLVDRGAEVVAVPSWTATEAGVERVARTAAARAVENQCYVATAPLVSDVEGFEGRGRGTVYAPCDDVVGPNGTRLQLPKDERAAATCTLDVTALRESRERAAVRPYADAGAGSDE
ncbi:MAG: nitrilase-related carbon-nitrogen hydrolase [Halanaeroarchaeum sp.]